MEFSAIYNADNKGTDSHHEAASTASHLNLNRGTGHPASSRTTEVQKENDSAAIIIPIVATRSVDSNASVDANANASSNQYTNADTAGRDLEMNQVINTNASHKTNINITNGNTNNHNEEDDDNDNLMAPLVSPSNTTMEPNGEIQIRSRKRSNNYNNNNKNSINDGNNPNHRNYHHRKEKLRQCCNSADELRRHILRNTITFMSIMAKLLFWVSLVVTAFGVFWYSKELALHGTDPHLIAWFSAGAFVILGFPISIYGILMHLTNYYQPNIQCYVIRILWMVPIYSIESWLCLRFHEFAIYIETLRDCYESYVLYCFLQFLIEVLGGEESLIMMLKDKSPTRGVHYAPLDWFMKPWVMGQPVSRVDVETGERTVQWTSPFFKYCKLGCLQYVLLKFVSTIFVLVLEHLDLYKEGDFTPKGGYLYICILTNTSQCWALYCLVFFYYATKNELGPIRPVGKFLAVKSLVFFTWWQALGIAMLHGMNLIPSYEAGGWSTEEVARGLQAYLICIEMFIAAILHIFIFPHTDYLKPLVISTPSEGLRHFKGRRVGRRFNTRRMQQGGGIKDDSSKSSDVALSYGELDALDKTPQKSQLNETNSNDNSVEDKYPLTTPEDKQQRKGFVHALIDSTLPRDVMDNTVGIARGDFRVEKKTLLYHAAASDQYSLFAKRRRAINKKDSDKSSDGDVELK